MVPPLQVLTIEVVLNSYWIQQEELLQQILHLLLMEKLQLLQVTV